MSSIANPQFEPPNNDELVAYLDGELPPEECRVVEERLANDAAYRQQLHDLDQAWEALGTLPPATVDDSFARTTIELACVQAENDLTQEKSLAAVEDGSRRRWWIAGSVVSTLVGFILVRALATHRSNALLADLPVIQQANVLSRVESTEFLRQLAKDVPLDELKKDKDDVAFQKELDDFRQVNSQSLTERRDWVDALSPDQKAALAERARAFDSRSQSHAERDRLRDLVNDVRHDPKLEETLIAYGEWLARQTAGQQEQLRERTQGLPTAEQVAEVRKQVHQEYEQAARHLSPADAKKLRDEIFVLAKEKKADVVKNIPPGREHDRVADLDVSKPVGALWVLHQLVRDNDARKATIDRLLSKLSPDAQEHWNKLGRGWREPWFQLLQWEHDALQPQWGPAELEQYFETDLTPEERQKLLDMPRSEMKSKLEQMYLSSKLGIDSRAQFFRDFGDGMRGPGSGPPNIGRPGDRGPEFGPGGPPGEPRFERGRPDRDMGPDGRRGPPPEDRMDNRRGGERRRRPPEDGPPPGPPPDDRRPPPPPGDRQPI